MVIPSIKGTGLLGSEINSSKLSVVTGLLKDNLPFGKKYKLLLSASCGGQFLNCFHLLTPVSKAETLGISRSTPFK